MGRSKSDSQVKVLSLLLASSIGLGFRGLGLWGLPKHYGYVFKLLASGMGFSV